MGKAKALGWIGGKVSYGKGDWIASLLPWEWNTTYVEPCGGMFGVGLARPPVKIELFNDLDERVVNWWRVVRDQSEEFGRLVEATPNSREEYEAQLAALDDESLSPLRRALAFHVVVAQSVRNSPASGPKQWRRTLENRGSLGRWRSERVALLAERMWNVQLEHCDAVDLLGRTAGLGHAVIYVDPPYPTAKTPLYAEQVDFESLGAALQAQRGRVAVSGYGDEWDHLGWRRASRQIKIRVPKVVASQARVEVLWMNYP